MKDDSGSYAAFTEQGSSACQMTAAKVKDFISRPLCCARHAGAKDAVEKEWEKGKTGMAADERQNKSEVSAEARNHGKTVHYASLLDLCHLKSSEL